MKLLRTLLVKMLPETSRARILYMLTVRKVIAVRRHGHYRDVKHEKDSPFWQYCRAGWSHARLPRPMSKEELRDWEGDPLDWLKVNDDKAARLPHPFYPNDSSDTGSQ